MKASGWIFIGARVAPSTGKARWSLPLNGASRLVSNQMGAIGGERYLHRFKRASGFASVSECSLLIGLVVFCFTKVLRKKR